MTKIMVVDNDRSTVEMVKTALELEGYETISAFGGQECLDKLKEMTVDLVILDIMMPEVDGIQVLRTMNEDEKLKKIPVILISALSVQSDAFQRAKRDVLNFPNSRGEIEKPFEIDNLLKTVRKALEKK
jgi:CheY-like chemotaxis protein